MKDRVSVFLAMILSLAAIAAAGNAFSHMRETEKAFDEKILLLQKQIGALRDALEKATGEAARVALSLDEIEKRTAVREKSQEDLITEAVANVTPAVVSVVVSKDVPLLEVVYRNPFGDDPFFKDFGFRIPVYRQRGVEKRKVGAGTGFLVREDGFLVTNRHVVADPNAEYTVLLSDGSQKKAQVIYRDAVHDLAVLKIDGRGYPFARLGDSRSLKLGQTVIAIGNALGEYNNSVSVGIISGLNRTIRASDASGRATELSGVLQTDAAINPGNSGGPLIDTNGKVIGVNVATVIGSDNIGFAIPSETVRESLRELISLP